MVRKWMDGRTVNEGRGTHSMVLLMLRTTEMSDEGLSATSSCSLDESSNRSRVVGVRGRSKGTMGGGMEEADSLELIKVRRGMFNDGRVRGSENDNLLADGLGGEAWMLRGRGALSRETKSVLAPVWRDRRGSYTHSASFSPFTHFVQGRLPSHL